MKIAIFFEGNPKMGGGFFQSLKSSLMITNINEYKEQMELIITDKEANTYFLDKKIKTRFFKVNIFKRYYCQLFEIDLIKNLLNKIKINHPFTNFIKKENYDLVIFLGPSIYAKYSKDISFVVNIWDLDHKKNSQFPEHNNNFTFENRENYINEIIYRAFKIIVPHENNKKDLINYYKCDKKNITVQNFIPMLPTIFENNKSQSIDYRKIYEKFQLP